MSMLSLLLLSRNWMTLFKAKPRKPELTERSALAWSQCNRPERRKQFTSHSWPTVPSPTTMNFHSSQLICVLALVCGVQQSLQYCSKFGRHLLQHQCVLTPESTEGPYYLETNLIRKDIREDREGLPFRLKMTFTDINTCEPLHNISVDVWQADASGQYSGYVEAKPTTTLHTQPTDSKTFLRGIQLTDKNGKAEFMTIFPGKSRGFDHH